MCFSQFHQTDLTDRSNGWNNIAYVSKHKKELLKQEALLDGIPLDEIEDSKIRALIENHMKK